ncbi:hypothetical protein J6590_018082 [Homalodisca vitripennis]|nr:hypothetical protein J6590_018082 [Homalodisca vitripennis]
MSQDGTVKLRSQPRYRIMPGYLARSPGPCGPRSLRRQIFGRTPTTPRSLRVPIPDRPVLKGPGDVYIYISLSHLPPLPLPTATHRRLRGCLREQTDTLLVAKSRQYTQFRGGNNRAQLGLCPTRLEPARRQFRGQLVASVSLDLCCTLITSPLLDSCSDHNGCCHTSTGRRNVDHQANTTSIVGSLPGPTSFWGGLIKHNPPRTLWIVGKLNSDPQSDYRLPVNFVKKKSVTI